MARGCARLIPVSWLTPRWRKAPIATIVASYGSVEIHQLPAGCVAQTCVKGGQAQALETGMRRLIRYTNGDNLGAGVLDAVRPVAQRQLSPGRWLVSIRLASADAALTAPTPRSPKVKVMSTESELLAVVRMTGPPSHASVAGGDMIVLTAISGTEWVATGAPIIRVHRRGPVRWFALGFEVAVPVSAR